MRLPRTTTVQAFPIPLDFQIPVVSSLLWQYNRAKALTEIVTQKDFWYIAYDNAFWGAWFQNVFNLVTANDFGLSVWSVILQVPLFLNSGAEIDNSEIWGFNSYDPPNTPPTLINTYQNFGGSDGSIGANFSGSADSTVLTTEQQRWLLRLRYLYLVSRGSIPQTNFNFNWLMESSIKLGLFSPTTPVANPVTLTGSISTASAVMSGLSTTEGLKVGLGIIGIGIPFNTTILSIDSATQITMSAKATATGTHSYEFGLPAMWVLDGLDMTITYQFNFFLPSVLQRALNLVKVLPNPSGVKVIKQYWSGSNYVNF